MRGHPRCATRSGCSACRYPPRAGAAPEDSVGPPAATRGAMDRCQLMGCSTAWSVDLHPFTMKIPVGGGHGHADAQEHPVSARPRSATTRHHNPALAPGERGRPWATLGLNLRWSRVTIPVGACREQPRFRGPGRGGSPLLVRRRPATGPQRPRRPRAALRPAARSRHR